MVIPEAAVLEIRRRGPTDPAVQMLAHAAWLISVDPGPVHPHVAAFGLGDGESAVLAHALANPGSGAIVDDQAARRAATRWALLIKGLWVSLSSPRRGH